MDFDEASKAWRSNKKHIGNGMFQYICEYIHSDGKKCKKTCYAYLSEKYNINGEFGKIKHKNEYIYCKKHLNKN